MLKKQAKPDESKAIWSALIRFFFWKKGVWIKIDLNGYLV
ncbi:hypothetical protein RV03_GL001718 [Enterococcus gallinarum]|nr:hypothetical protein RV03_GL001718 [Enterococcus gallinarum]